MLTVCIQAGGASSRMGEDKALKPFLGRPLIQRVIERLAPIADELVVTTNRPEDYRFLGVRLAAAMTSVFSIEGMVLAFISARSLMPSSCLRVIRK